MLTERYVEMMDRVVAVIEERLHATCDFAVLGEGEIITGILVSLDATTIDFQFETTVYLRDLEMSIKGDNGSVLRIADDIVTKFLSSLKEEVYR